MEVPQIMYGTADPVLIEKIVGELKSQGTFDQFRKECIADVDTKPAYQNLHQRVETTVSNFLEGKAWRPDLNKNQLRDSLRKHIHEMGFLETGVERIVDQVVNPKVNTVFMPQVEDVVYRVQGLPKPDKKSSTNSSSTMGSTSKSGGLFNTFSQPPPLLPGLSFLPPALQSHMQKPPTLDDLLPKDLDPVSPESSKESLDCAEPKEEYEKSTRAEDIGLIKHHDDSMDSQLSGISDLTSHGSNRNKSPKLERKASPGSDAVNEDSRLSKGSSNSRLLGELSEKNSQRSNENLTTVQLTDALEEKECQIDSRVKPSISLSETVMEYGDQFSKEEEVATTATTHNMHDDALEDARLKEEEIVTDSPCKENTPKNKDNAEIMSLEDGQLKSSSVYTDPVNLLYENNEELSANALDDTSLAQSEDSHFSGSSDNKLQIDELKDFNSQSESSHQNENEDKSKTGVENIVEASEEARHGFDDSQDALERPPIPWTTSSSVQSVAVRPPLPPLPPAGSLNVDEKPPPPPNTSPISRQYSPVQPRPPSTPPIPNDAFVPQTPPMEDAADLQRLDRPSTPCAARPSPSLTPPYVSGRQFPPSPPLGNDRAVERPPHPPTPPVDGVYAAERPPPPPTPPLDGVDLATERPVSPRTPPFDRDYFTERQPPPPPPPLDGAERPPPPPPSPPVNRAVERPQPPLTPPTNALNAFERSAPQTPPLDEKCHFIEESFRPPTPQAAAACNTPPALINEEFSRDSNMSPTYDDGAVPKTPRWEPRSPGMDNERLSSSYPMFDYLGISASNQQQQPLPISSNPTHEQDDESQTSSEDMQLAWSPLSFHGDLADELNSGKNSRNEQCQFSDDIEKSQVLSKEKSTQEKLKGSSELNVEQHQESKNTDKLKSGDNHDYDYDRHREKDKFKDGKSREKHKDDHRSHKTSSSSSKKHDSKSKHKDSRDRKESSSKSRHDDKKRSDKDRVHSSSSHSRSDDRKKDEKRDDRERTSSSKHKSSRGDEQRHRDRDKKNSSSHTHHDTKSHDKTSKNEDKSKSFSKSQSGDREKREKDKRDKDPKDRERKSERERDHLGKDTSRPDEKRREREKDKKEKSSNVCRPNDERRSPNPDSNSGSTYGGNSQSLSTFSSKGSQSQSKGEQENKEVSSSKESNNKSHDSSQPNTSCSEFSALSSCTKESVSPSSSLPFKKRPLFPEGSNKQEYSSRQLILRIKKARKNDDVSKDATSTKMKAIRRLEYKSVQNLDNYHKYTSKAGIEAELPPPQCGSPLKYFGNDWPTKSDDEAFMAYVKTLDQSKSLSGLSDFSQSDSEEEEEEILNVDDDYYTHGLVEKSVKLSLSILTDDQASKLSELSFEACNTHRRDSKGKRSEPKINSGISKPHKNRSRFRKTSEGGGDLKRRRMSMNMKEVIQQPPVETKSRRARKPNKRYSNEEFTSHFDCDDLESSEAEENVIFSSNNTCESMKGTQLRGERLVSASSDHRETALTESSADLDHLHKEHKYIDDDDRMVIDSSEASKSPVAQSKQSTFSWNRDMCNSNSEDEMDSANTESDIIGTALKNLMMESGLGGPEGESDSNRLSQSTPSSITSNSSSGSRKRSVLLSGVKRVGLSKHYRGSKKSPNSLNKLNSVRSCISNASLPPRSRSDVSSLSCDSGSSQYEESVQLGFNNVSKQCQISCKKI